MVQLVGKKQRSTNEQWQFAWAHVTEYISRCDIEARIESTVENVLKVLNGRNAAFGWSGGKDSIALQFVMEAAGIHECVMGLTNLEYPAFLSWVTAHMPDGLEVINTGLDIEWLKRNPSQLFPQTAAQAARWFSSVQHRAQRQYFKNRDVDVLILGRRRMDGNYIGQTDGVPIYATKDGTTRYCPMADWSHEEILALIRYFDLPIPPIYSWPRGWQVGTGPWPARQWTKSVQHGWSEVYSIDPSVVRFAADHLESAAEFLSMVE